MNTRRAIPLKPREQHEIIADRRKKRRELIKSVHEYVKRLLR